MELLGYVQHISYFSFCVVPGKLLSSVCCEWLCQSCGLRLPLNELFMGNRAGHCQRCFLSDWCGCFVTLYKMFYGMSSTFTAWYNCVELFKLQLSLVFNAWARLDPHQGSSWSCTRKNPATKRTRGLAECLSQITKPFLFFKLPRNS